MWFKRNGHRAKSHQNQSEVFDERKKKATKVHEGISATQRLNKRTKHALELRQKGLSFNKIGQELGIGSERARQIVRKYQHTSKIA